MEIRCSNQLTSGRVLKILYEHTQQFGRGKFVENRNLSDREWEEMSTKGYIDYMGGRPIKVDFTSYPKLNLTLYARDSSKIDDVIKLISKKNE